jgi:hypothetical protein
MVLYFVHQLYVRKLGCLCPGHFAVPTSLLVQGLLHQPVLASEMEVDQDLHYAPTSSNCGEMLQLQKACFQAGLSTNVFSLD